MQYMSSNSSNSSGGGGNTITPPSSKPKQISPAKRWCFTLNNWTSDEYSSIVPIIERECSFAIIGDEIGATGTPHLQGYIEFKNKCRALSKFESRRFHWEKAKGSRENNIAYCSKEKVLFSLGMPKPIKVIGTLKPWQHQIECLIATEPDDRTIHWFFDRVGNIGKTVFMKYCVIKHGAIPCIGGKFGDIMNLVFNSDMDKSNTTIFNIPRGHREHISYSSLEAVKDGMIVNTKYETGYKCFNSPHVIVFANFPPDKKQLSKDRWNIVNVGEHNRQWKDLLNQIDSYRIT
ncbi:MAG: putative viral replication protein [Cressdnaviricota sp.]|nr:MAG: putative viral replication protein [Cressdnaviricota sp.]